MSEILIPLGYQLGVGGVGGFLVGYAIKKVIKIMAVILGLFLLSLAYLGYTGMIDVNYDKLEKATSGLVGMIGQAPLLTPIVSHIPFAASFIVGFALGFKKG
ncbi:MAG: FUN14 family protein [Candidatus Bathyarchaeota archaeon BA1]|nr:MAG: FUN14 family protein [Candidatus Bathyarchaeota archaeon BA1]